MERPQIGGVSQRVLPLRLQQVSGAFELEPAVDLLPADSERVACLHAVGIEEVLQELFEILATLVRLHIQRMKVAIVWGTIITIRPECEIMRKE